MNEKFWRHVAKSHDCWLWHGALYTNGYGRVRVSTTRCIVAHRISWTLARGPIPEGLIVCHKCDVRNCVRPEHLFLGTHADNIHDCMKKGRRAKLFGTSHPMAKLSDDKIVQIRIDFRRGIKGVDLALTHGVTPQMISYIVNRKSWTHI